MNQQNSTKSIRHLGPHLGGLAIIFAFLFNLSLYFVITFSPDQPHYPRPWEPAEVITNYFRDHAHDVLLNAFFQFGAAIPLAIFTATIVSRLRFLGVKAAGAYIAMIGGFLTVVDLIISSQINWVLAYPGIAQDPAIVRPFYYLIYAIGGVGYSVPLGLLIAGVAVTSTFTKLLPKWLTWSGVALAVCGELSWFSLVFPKLLFLIPLTRFPGFIWLIITGFLMPKTVEKNL